MLREATFQEAETLRVTKSIVQAHCPFSSKSFEGLWVFPTHLWLRSVAEDWCKFPANAKGDGKCPAQARQRHPRWPPPPPPPRSGSQAVGGGAYVAFPECQPGGGGSGREGRKGGRPEVGGGGGGWGLSGAELKSLGAREQSGRALRGRARDSSVLFLLNGESRGFAGAPSASS